MSNYFETVENAFREILACGLAPFVKREMNARYGEDWVKNDKVSVQSYHLKKGDLNWSDIQAVLKLMIDQWNNVFQQKLGTSNRSLVFELRDIRNKLVHEGKESFDFANSFRALQNIELLLSAIPNDPLAREKSCEAATKHKELLVKIVETHSKRDESLFRWHDICGVMLLQKQRDSLRRKATEIGAEVNVYVSLDLLYREERPRNDSSKPEREDNKPVFEIEKTYKHDDFLESLTERHSKNKHIAIAGEAGAGKTTLLARIAEELHTQGQLTIFISLADLQDKSLYDYIYESWLAGALGKRKGSATDAQKDDLFEQFKAGKIWLLLDGLDEMQSKTSADASYRIEHEIKGAIEQPRVILTCRLNVWDKRLNGLSNFDTFRMGNFSPEQVDEFISDWFVSAECSQSGTILQVKLKESNRDRIRDMVRHPLRLALLCQAFYRNPDAELPETKAGLYELFVRYFYEWKPNIVSVDLNDSLKDELHQALGKLAIAGIDGDEGFRLSRSLAVKEMGDPLFGLACDLGWINLVDLNESEERVYSFFHATFQEYFAALAINNREFFLNHVPNNPNQGVYRIFESNWKQVLLMWLGRSGGGLLQEKKCFIQDFNDFYDSCNNLSFVKLSLDLLVEYTSEFSDFDKAYNIIYATSTGTFGWWDEDEFKWKGIPLNISKLNMKLLNIANKKIVATIVDEIYFEVISAIESTENYPDLDSYEKLVIKAQLFSKELELSIMLASLGKIDKINRLLWWLENSPIHAIHGDTQLKILPTLEKVCIGNEKVIKALLKIVLQLETCISSGIYLDGYCWGDYPDFNRFYDGDSPVKEPSYFRAIFNIFTQQFSISGPSTSIPTVNKIDQSAIKNTIEKVILMKEEEGHVKEEEKVVISSLDDLYEYLTPNVYDYSSASLINVKKTLSTIDTLGISQNIIFQNYKSQLVNAKDEISKLVTINKIVDANILDTESESEIIHLLNHSEDIYIRIIAAMVLLKNKSYRECAEDSLIQFLNHPEVKEYEVNKMLIAEFLIRNSYSPIATEHSVRIIINYWHQLYYSYSDIYYLQASSEEKEYLDKYDYCRREIYYSTLREFGSIFSKNQISITTILNLINERVESFPIAIEFLQYIAKHSYEIELVNALTGMLNDINVSRSIKIYSTLVLCKIYPTHQKVVEIIIKMLSNFSEIDSEIFSKILTNLYEIDTSRIYVECTNSQLLRDLELSLSKLINNDDLNITDRLKAAYTLWKINPNNSTSQNFIISQLTDINSSYSIVKGISEKIPELIPISNNKQSLFDQILSSLEEDREIKEWLPIVTCLLKASCNDDRLITEIIFRYLHTKSDSIGALLNGIVQNIEYPRFHKLWETCENKLTPE
jgi:energy-coupling factor transporter ATP-binding protein EcfA2